MNRSFTPLFFDGCNGPLYGVHHAPEENMDRSHGVLFLPPLGQEYKRCHKSLQKLAGDLAGAGFHVLRFDYAGSGDSVSPVRRATGGTEPASNIASWSLETWHEDARDALRQLQTMSDVRDVSALGVRLGASVATQLDVPWANLMFWDPIGDGPAYLDELDVLNRDLLNKFRHSFRNGRKVEIPKDQMVGHDFPGAMRDSLKEFKLTTPGGSLASRALWIDADPTPATAAYPQFKGRLAEKEHHCQVGVRCRWRSLAEIGNVIMGQPLARQVLLHLKDENGAHGNSA